MNGGGYPDPLGNIPIQPAGGTRGSGRPSRSQDPDAVRPLFSRRRTPPKRKSRWPLLSIVLPLLCVGLYAACGFSLVPWLLRTAVPQALSKQINRPVTLREAAFNPFTLELRLENGIIGPDATNPSEQADHVLAFGSFFLDIEFRSLLAGALVTRVTELDNFFIHVVRGADGGINLRALLPKTRSGGEQKRPLADLFAALPLPFSLGNLRLTEGRVLFDDRISGKSHKIEHIKFIMPVVVSDPGLSTAGLTKEGQLLSPQFSATVNGSPIDLAGESRVKQDTWTATLKLDLKDFNLASLPAVSVSGGDKKGLAQGIADLQGSLIFSASTGGRLALTFSGDGAVRDVLVEGEEESALRIGAATFSGTFEPLLQSFQFKDITLTNPELRAGQGKDHAWHWPLPSPSSDSRATFAIDNFTVKSGTVAFTNLAFPGNSSNWSEVELNLQGLSLPCRTQTSYSLQAKGDGNATLRSQGAFTLGPLSMDGDFKVSGADTGRLALLKTFLPEGVKPSGRLASLTGRYSIQPKNEKGEKAWFLTDLAFALEDFSLAMGEDRWLHLPIFALRDGQVNSEERSVELGVGEGEVDEILLRWDQTGKLNWNIFQSAQSSPDNGLNDWSFGLQSLTVKQSSITFESQEDGAAQKFRLDNINATAGALSSRKDAQGTVSGAAAMNGKGYIGFGGYLSLSPPAATLQCDIADIPVDSLAPFLKNWFQPEVTGGILQAKGDLKLPQSQFTGLAAVTGFTAKAEGRKVVAFTRAIAQDATLSFSPFDLDIKILSLERPYLLWHIPADGRTGLTRLFGATDGSYKKRETSSHLNIGEIRLTDGSLDFHDATVTPACQTGIASISGVINGLENKPDNRAAFALHGMAGSRATISLTGPFGFFDENLFVDANIKASGVDMTTIAQYVEPGLGYKVDRGNLDMVTRYRNSAGKVEAENTAILTGFKLGKRIDGGLTLPLTLALLTNPKNEISLDLPVSGGTADPSFSFRTNIIAVFRNLLLKAAVAPFSVLSSLLPGQNLPHYEHLVFPYGSFELNSENRALLKELAKVFQERPSLRLRLRGTADAKGDRDAIVAERLQWAAPRALETGGKQGRKGAASEQTVVVKDEELIKLAAKRASVIRNALLSLGMRNEQLALDAKASLVSPEDTGGKHGNRVDFLLEAMNE